MPASPLTTECRAIAARWASFSNIEGNVQMLRKIVYEDADKVEELRLLVQADSPADPLVGKLVTAHARASNAMECSGNLQLHALMIASAADVAAAADFVDAIPPPEPPPEGTSTR